MRRILRSILQWLDSRFPEKVVVTQKTFVEAMEMLKNQSKKVEELQARVGQLETGIRNISMQMGFAGKIPGDFNLER